MGDPRNTSAGIPTSWRGHCCACAGVCYHVGGPSYCTRHDPARFATPPPTVVVTGTTTWPPTALTDADVERIARRVVELLKEPS